MREGVVIDALSLHFTDVDSGAVNGRKDSCHNAMVFQVIDHVLAAVRTFFKVDDEHGTLQMCTKRVTSGFGWFGSPRGPPEGRQMLTDMSHRVLPFRAIIPATISSTALYIGVNS